MSANEEPGTEKKSSRIVPKFASFKPPVQLAKPPATIERVLEAKQKKEAEGKGAQHQFRHHVKRERSTSRSRNSDRERHRSRRHRSKEREPGDHRDRNSKHTSHENYRRSKFRDREDLPKSEPGWPSPIASALPSWDADSTSSNLNWAFDRKGDPANLTYGFIHRYSVPSYYRSGYGRIIGLPPETRIQEDKGDGKGLVLVNGGFGGEQNRKLKTEERSCRFALTSGVRKLKIVKESEKGLAGGDFEGGLNFVPLQRRKKRKRGDGEEDNQDMNGRYTHSMTGLIFSSVATQAQLEDEDLEYATSSSEEDEMFKWESSSVRSRTIELQHKVDLNPADVDAWLALVAHQDDILYSGKRNQRVTNAEKQSTAEIKLSIIKKALDAAKVSTEGKERLLEAYFGVGASIWEPKKLLSRYTAILKQNPGMHKIWMHYLDFRQADFHSFKYKEMIKCYDDCLEILRKSLFSLSDNREDRAQLEKVAVYVLLRGLKFVREAGFTETALGALQALLELNLCPPKSLSRIYPPMSEESYDRIVDELGKFWDSEVLRIGESGGEGWDKYVENGYSGTLPDTCSRNTGPNNLGGIDISDPLGSWAEMETSSFEKTGWPARTIDGVEDEDPHRVVLFEDIRMWMFVFSEELSIRKLIDGAIQLCGLPCWIFAGNCELDDWSRGKDTFLADKPCLDRMAWFWPEQEDTRKVITWQGMEPERGGGLTSNAFSFRLSGGYPLTEDMLFGRGNGEWPVPFEELKAFHGLKLVKGVLMTLLERNLFGPEMENRLALFWLAIEWRLSPKESKKIAKSLLKEFRHSLLLWNAYAQIEWRDNNIDAARNVFTTVLKMSKSLPAYQRKDSIILWKTWAWEETLDGNYERALQVLLSIPNPSEIQGEINKTAVLKARRYIADEKARQLSLGQYYHAFIFNETLALIEYLSPIVNTPIKPNFDPSIAIPVYDSLLADMKERGLASSWEYEIALMNGKVRLLYHHSRTSKLFRVKFLREALEEAISEVQEGRNVRNSLLWSLYAWNEGRTRIEGRVTGWLRDKIVGLGDKNVTLLGWEFCIWAESRMTGDTAHSMRRLFERALENENTRASVTLWKLYVEFECRQKDPARAKMLLFQALENCPWSKDIAMLAFTNLFAALDWNDLKRVLSVSIEKELRLHDTLELEKALEKIGEVELKKIYPGVSIVNSQLQNPTGEEHQLLDDKSSDEMQQD